LSPDCALFGGGGFGGADFAVFNGIAGLLDVYSGFGLNGIGGFFFRSGELPVFKDEVRRLSLGGSDRLYLALASRESSASISETIFWYSGGNGPLWTSSVSEACAE
jgi:hypothetical protein